MKQLIKKLAKKISPTTIAVLIVGGAVLAGGASAAVHGMINGKKIKPNTITSKQIKNRTIVSNDINKATLKQLKGKNGLVGPIGPKGAVGPAGPKGDVGPAGPAGADGEVGPTGAAGVAGSDGTDGTDGATGPAGETGSTGATGPAGSVEYQGVNWGVDYRNTIGSPVAQLRAGPAPAPYGIGALGLEVGDSAAHSERVAFSNEIDFAGDLVADLDEVGFQVYTTGENSDGGYNMPNIAIEIDPNGAAGTTTGYSTLLFNPDGGSTDRNSEPNVWSPYLDGTTSGTWGLTGSQFNTPPNVDCGYNYGGCSFDDLQAYLATGDGATITTVGVSKGRDKEWLGAVDGLRINDEVFDFEPFGVSTLAAE